MLRAMWLFAQTLKPDLTLLLDLDVERCLQAQAQRGGMERLEAYEVAFHQRVRAGYRELWRAGTGRWRRD
jgi:dTMP kinase